jgi:hypothetical protein
MNRRRIRGTSSSSSAGMGQELERASSSSRGGQFQPLACLGMVVKGVILAPEKATSGPERGPILTPGQATSRPKTGYLQVRNGPPPDLKFTAPRSRMGYLQVENESPPDLNILPQNPEWATSMPLALGGHMNFIVSHCGIGPGSYGRMHRWMGRATIFEGSILSIMAAS